MSENRLSENRWDTAKVLDCGFVHLLDTMPHWSKMSGDSRVVQAARVSTAHLPDEVLEALGVEPVDEDRTPEQDAKLIDYMMRNEHGTPFEKVRFEFVVKLPIFIARQWIRHRMGSFNEMSARYSKLPREFYVPALNRMQAQSASNKQGSGESLETSSAGHCQSTIWSTSLAAYEAYESMLDAGLARELARTVLLTNYYTQWYWTVDLRNLMSFLKLRLHSHAQYEIRVYAEAILGMVEKVAPISIAAFRRHMLKEAP